MHARQVRFGSQWFLVGVIFFYTVGAAMIARHMHMEKIVTPTSAGGSECATIPDVQESATSLSATSLIQSDGDGSQEPSLVARRTGHGSRVTSHGKMADAFGTERSSNGSDTTETPWHGLPAREKTAKMAVPQTSDTVGTNTPAKQVPTKVRTKIRFVEAILKKAVIEPYYINGQIEGLQITGLDRISVARDLLLKSGDIIRAVNGQTLNSKQQAYEIFKKARTKPIMIVDLLQDGEAKTLLFDFR